MRIAPLATVLLVAACGGGTMPDMRPLAPAQSTELSPFDQAYQAGKSHLMADRLGLALVMFEKALAYEPLSVAALNGMGAAYDQLHRPELAKVYYAKALILEPSGADTLNNMAISVAMAGDAAMARKLLNRAADIEPTNATIRNNLQIAGMAPQDPRPSQPDADVTRPQLERSGLMELTLTIPATQPASRDPLAPIRFKSSTSAQPISTGEPSPPVEIAVAATEAPVRAVRIERVSPAAPQRLVHADGSPTLAAVQLGALAGGQIDLIGLLPHVPRDRVTSEALPAPETVRPVPDRNAVAPASTADRVPPVVRRSCTLEVSNGVGRTRMAMRVQGYLTGHGVVVGRRTNSTSFDQTVSILFHRPEGAADALRVAALLPVPVVLQPDAALECSVRLALGRDLLPFDQTLSKEES